MNIKKFLTIILILISSSLLAQNRSATIYSAIPFIRGADHCYFQNRTFEKRFSYIKKFIKLGNELLSQKRSRHGSLDLVKRLDGIYQDILISGGRENHLDVSLKSTLKAYTGKLYKKYNTPVKNIKFKNIYSEDVDYLAYGSYALSPDCSGKIQVTFHLIGRDSKEISFEAIGLSQYVMSNISAQMFVYFQRTQFPSTLDIGGDEIVLLGGPNKQIAKTNRPDAAARICQSLNGRLPEAMELELISEYGDFGGGVSIGKNVWAIAGDSIYHPLLLNSSPVRQTWEVNETSFYYYCVR